MIDKIKKKIGKDQFEFSKHAVDQSIIRRISVREVKEAISNGEIIENYPKDKYGPSCLIFGTTKEIDHYTFSVATRQDQLLRLSLCMNRILRGGSVLRKGNRL